MTAPSLPEDASQRNRMPMADGLLDYFPNALAYVSMVSLDGNDQHNAGQPLHWARNKSTDHRNKIMRHLADFDCKDERGIYHAGRAAWRSLALLQELLEREEGAPLPRNARLEVVECGGCAPPVHASPRELYEEALAIALGQDRCLYDYMAPPNCDGLHPMHAETLRDHDERLNGAEDKL